MSAALPSEFVSYTRRLFGEERFERFLRSFDEAAPVSVRLNPFKPGRVFDGVAVPWCRDGLWLAAREDFTLDPLFHAGCYYVQEAGGMFLDHVLRQLVREPVTMLDVCAAPGGKATLARAALPDGSLLYCNEPDRRRANILVENIQKQGHTDVVVTCNYAADYKKAGLKFDVILADVPCSGEGMFRKDDGAIREWSVGNVVRLAELQRNIIGDVWQCLRQDGLLVYSTCTFNTRENEENVVRIAEQLGADVVGAATDDWNICGSLLDGFTQPVYRFIPGTTRTEGLFMAVLRKTSDDVVKKKVSADCLHVLHDGRNIPHTAPAPPHAEALLYNLPKERYPQVELSRDTALSYLRREAIRLDEDSPRGFVVVCYEGHPLGFVKNLGTRANNLYPQEWRIRYK